MPDSPLVRKGRFLPLFALLLIFSNTLFAQPISEQGGPRSNQVNSPYSRYGIGDINDAFGTDFRGMGGAATAGTPKLNTNDFNPASYSFLSAASLDFALEANRRSVSLGGSQTASGTGNFGYFNLGMNVGKHFGLNIGFKPIANMYYNANDTPSIPALGQTIKNFNGSGNLQYAFIGLACQYKGLSIGANFGYVFGNYNYSSSLKTSGSDTTGTIYSVRSAEIDQKDIIGGVYWKGGILYHHEFKKEKFFNVGITATISQKLNVIRQSLAMGYNFLSDSSTGDMVIDTIQNSETSGKLIMPATYSFGMAFGKGVNWQVAGDFTYTDWSVFENMGERDGVGQNAWRASLGGAFTPDASAVNKKYLSYVTYRVGAYYGKDYFNLFNSGIHYFGGTIGASFPLQRNYNNFGKINLALDIGQRGTLQNGLAKEVYVNFTFGVSLNDTYWLKRPAHYQ